MRSGITPRMRQCLDALRILTINDVPPTYDEIAAHIGIKSKSGVHRYLQSLQERGYLTAPQGHARKVVVFDLNPVGQVTDRDLMESPTDVLMSLAERASAIIAERAG